MAGQTPFSALGFQKARLKDTRRAIDPSENFAEDKKGSL